MLNSEIQMFLAEEQSDADTNGGRVDFTEQVVSGGIQNVWPHVPKSLRDSGNEPDGQWRKVFIANRNPNNEAIINPGVFYDGDTLGSDWARHFPVGQRDIQGDWVGSPPARRFASGVLNAVSSPSDTSISVLLADPSQTLDFIDLDQLYITDKVDPDSVAGSISQPKIAGVPTIAGLVVTIPLDRQIGYAFAALTTKVGSVYVPGYDTEPTLGNVVVTTASDLVFDDTTVVLGNLGTVEHELTLEFTTETQFTVTSDDPKVGTSGVLAPGDIFTTYEPSNPVSVTPYISIPAAAYSGTATPGDTIVIPTHPSTIPQVQNRVIPINCPSLTNNRLRVVSIGESET